MGNLLTLTLANALLATLLAGLVYLAGRRLRHPPLIHALWILVLLKFLTPPVLHWPVPCFSPWAGSQISRHVSAVSYVEFEKTPADAVPPPVETQVVRVAHAGQTHLTPNSRREQFADWGYSAVAAIWLLGTLLCGGLGLKRHRRLRRLLHYARPAPPAWQRQAEALAARLGLQRCGRVWTVPGRIPPMVIFRRGGPQVVLPDELMRHFSENRRAAVLLHELAHIRRGDRWVRRLETVVRAVYWWYPPLIWIGRQLRAAEELCCDTLVVAHLPDGRRDYAQVLLETVDFLAAAVPSRRFRHTLAMSAFSTLQRRVTMVLEESLSARLSWRAGLLVIVAGLLVLPAGLHFVEAEELPPLQAPPDAKAAESPASTPKDLAGSASGSRRRPPEGVLDIPSQPSLADLQRLKVKGAPKQIEMTVHSSHRLGFQQKIPETQVSYPEILDLIPLSPTQVQLHAKKPGVTEVFLWDEDKKRHTFDVTVHADCVYRIELRFVRTNPGGKEHVLSAPTLTVPEGRFTCVSDTAWVSPPEVADLSEPMPFGNGFRGRVFRKGGQIFLEATFRRGDIRKEEAQAVRVATKELRVVEPIQLGKTITIDCSDADSEEARVRFELVVEAVEKTAEVGEVPQSSPASTVQ